MHHDLIKQLHIFRRKALRQTEDVFALRQIIGHGCRYGLGNRHTVQQRAKILQSCAPRQAALCHVIGHSQQAGTVLCGQSIKQPDKITMVQCSQHALHGFKRDFAGGISNRLICQRERIPHGTLCTLRQQAQRRHLKSNLFLSKNIFEMTHDMARRHLLEIKLQTA